jgi:glycosyltransferase involved in cell wall biosynthesis
VARQKGPIPQAHEGVGGPGLPFGPSPDFFNPFLGMKVLHAAPSVDPAFGGTAEMVQQLGQVMADSEVATLDDPGSAPVKSCPFWDRLHPLGPGQGKYGTSQRFWRWLSSNRKRFDAIIVHGLWQYHGYAVWKLAGETPYVVFPHGMLDAYHRRAARLKHLKKQAYWLAVERHIIAGARRVLFTSAEERERAQRTFIPYRVAAEDVVGGGIRDPAGRPGALKTKFFSEYPHLRGRRWLLYLGRIHPKKGLDQLIRAYAVAAAEGWEVDLVLAGAGEDRYIRALKRLVPKGLGSRVHWIGPIYSEAKYGALHAADAFVLTSHQENLCLAAIEAMACGCPVLLTNEVAVAYVAAETGAGYRVPDSASGVRDLLDAWRELGAEDRSLMRQAARECYETHFPIDRFVSRILEALRPVVF